MHQKHAHCSLRSFYCGEDHNSWLSHNFRHSHLYSLVFFHFNFLPSPFDAMVKKSFHPSQPSAKKGVKTTGPGTTLPVAPSKRKLVELLRMLERRTIMLVGALRSYPASSSHVSSVHCRNEGCHTSFGGARSFGESGLTIIL